MAVDDLGAANRADPRRAGPVRVMVIGGGLAGMSAALQLAKRGCEVLLYEASHRLGGKAGANLNQQTRQYDDHGFHIFPRWYLNIWNLVDELGIRHKFIDLHDFFQLRDSDYRSLPVHRFNTLHDASAWWNLKRNLRTSALSIPETLLFFYATLDLATHRLSDTAQLDQISITGFLRSKFYATEQMATVFQDLMLKAISVPSYFVSAATTRHVIRFWMNYPVPQHSILLGDLQTSFIEPFQKSLETRNVRIALNHRLERLNLLEGRIASVDMLDLGARASRNIPVDHVVLAIPAERVADVCTTDIYQRCTTVGNLRNLRTRPMAAFNLYFRDRIPNLPSSHVNLIDSKYGLTFIDAARIWADIPGSILNVIATDYTELEGVDPDIAASSIVAELQRFIPFEGNRLTNITPQPHLNEPLFMNDVGIWHFRPRAVPVNKDLGDAVEIDNLFLAGDYCRSHVDLVSMEGAFVTGFNAAEALAKRVLNVEPQEAEDPGRRISPLWWFVWLIGFPFARLLKLYTIASPTKKPIRKKAEVPAAADAPRMRT